LGIPRIREGVFDLTSITVNNDGSGAHPTDVLSENSATVDLDGQSAPKGSPQSIAMLDSAADHA
jgi:hypothetical protein